MKVWLLRRQLSIGPEEDAVVVKEVVRSANEWWSNSPDKRYWIQAGLFYKQRGLSHWLAKREEGE